MLAPALLDEAADAAARCELRRRTVRRRTVIVADLGSVPQRHCEIMQDPLRQASICAEQSMHCSPPLPQAWAVAPPTQLPF
jgi:hypothetical protein